MPGPFEILGIMLLAILFFTGWAAVGWGVTTLAAHLEDRWGGFGFTVGLGTAIPCLLGYPILVMSLLHLIFT
jgi:hypothetical protein